MNKFMTLSCLLSLMVVSMANAEKREELTIGANFYKSTNYIGTAYYYPESNNIINLEYSDLNDKFRSVDVGLASKVLAWRHSTDDQYGQYFKIYEEDAPNLWEMDGLTKLKIIPKQSEEVLIRLIDKSGSNKKFCLYANVFSPDAQASNVVACTDDLGYQVVGYIVNSGDKIVSSLQVRNAQIGDPDYGTFINSGNVFYVNQNRDINIATDHDSLVNFPQNMDYEVIGNNRIDFHLTSSEPSFPE
ncbi:hypothetical protein AYY27_07175 [Photobacterium damselae]|nr:beta/gamma crystallin domain-containing protein [Photobacterium damselae]OBU42639.1 hypothetical protein AYY27_07175 [Photobacterium damselae]